jgi:hypothetical protein
MPTSTLVSYELLIVRAGDGNSIVVINLTANEFPLALLQLGEGNGALTGSQWGVVNLANGACVGAWKAGEAPNVPGGLNCQMAGNPLELKKKDLFGGESFLVYYDGKQVGECDKNQNQCSISFVP